MRQIAINMSKVESPFGTCELCSNEADIINILPITQPDGKLDTMACTECSETSEVYCLEHRRPHIGFDDNTSACVECIETELDENAEDIYESFISKMSSDKKNKVALLVVHRWAMVSSEVRGEEIERALARFIITVSKRIDISTDEVIERTVDEGASVLLPAQIIRELTIREN